jgi:hypothetical protein
VPRTHLAAARCQGGATAASNRRAAEFGLEKAADERSGLGHRYHLREQLNEGTPRWLASGVGALFRGRHPTLYMAVSVKNRAADKPPAKRVRVARRCPFADALSGPAFGPRAGLGGGPRLTHVLPGCFQAFPSLPTG